MEEKYTRLIKILMAYKVEIKTALREKDLTDVDKTYYADIIEALNEVTRYQVQNRHRPKSELYELSINYIMKEEKFARTVITSLVSLENHHKYLARYTAYNELIERIIK